MIKDRKHDNTKVKNVIFMIPRAILSFIFLITMTVSFSIPAAASVPTPRIKPKAPNLSSYLSDKDAKRFREALRYAKSGSWSRVSIERNRINDPITKDVVLWIESMKNPHVAFDDISHVVHNMTDWPKMTAIQAKAEGMMFDQPKSASKTVEWFRTLTPVSGEGRATFAKAHYALGNETEGDYWLKLAWRESRLTRDRQRTLFGRYKKKLTSDDHYARADHLIWEGRRHFSKAEALLPHLNKSQRAVINARLKVAGNRSGMNGAIESVPAEFANDTGLLYERGKWRRKRKSKDYALPMYLQMDAAPVSPRGKDRVWREKKIMIYWLLEKKSYQKAYNLTLGHGMTRGAGFAEAEFLAGWLALTHLGQPEKAATHFQTLRQGVSTPVSLSRAHYWYARALERQNDPVATIHYSEAANYPNTYYGQLAAEKIHSNSSQIILPPEPQTDYLRAQFESDRRVRAMRILAELGEERYFTLFAFHLDDILADEAQLSLLAQLAKEYGYMRPSLRAAKQASRFQSMLTDSGYPRIDAIEGLSKKFDIPFVYAIARQESEFDYKAVSSARAYGMMQMINGTAKVTARRHRIPYSRSRMTTDQEYSAELGALHLNDLLEQFDGSYILAAAAYNAGGHRSRAWVKTYGDPRKGEIDPVDWVESIPFSETRNYVQRVMENMQVYRARLNGNLADNKIYEDITFGAQ